MAERIFADAQTRVGFETAQVVERLSMEVGPESVHDRFREISFDSLAPLDEQKGLTAIFVAGRVGFTGKGVLLVPARTVRILDTLGISYREDING
jgi:hypothetical protein